MARSPLDLGAYALPGRVADPRPGLEQARAGEALGLGSIWVAERWEKKEIAATLGALTQRTERVKLVAGMTHFGTRHPIVLAGMASTLQALSGNRFVLGFGRSVAFIWKNLGIPVPVNAAMADYARILRSLWAGETVTYDGPAGRYPKMRMPELPEMPPPLILAAIGPKTLALAGQHFDGAVLHPFLTPEGVARSVAIVRKAAEEADRDPDGGEDLCGGRGGAGCQRSRDPLGRQHACGDLLHHPRLGCSADRHERLGSDADGAIVGGSALPQYRGTEGLARRIARSNEGGDRRIAAALARGGCCGGQFGRRSRSGCSIIAAQAPMKSCCTGPPRIGSVLWYEPMASSELPSARPLTLHSAQTALTPWLAARLANPRLDYSVLAIRRIRQLGRYLFCHSGRSRRRRGARVCSW